MTPKTGEVRTNTTESETQRERKPSNIIARFNVSTKSFLLSVCEKTQQNNKPLRPIRRYLPSPTWKPRSTRAGASVHPVASSPFPTPSSSSDAGRLASHSRRITSAVSRAECAPPDATTPFSCMKVATKVLSKPLGSLNMMVGFRALRGGAHRVDCLHSRPRHAKPLRRVTAGIAIAAAVEGSGVVRAANNNNSSRSNSSNSKSDHKTTSCYL